MDHSRSIIRIEIAYWLQYFTIAFVASSVAYSVFEASQRLGPVGHSDLSGGAVEINIKEMVLSMWHGYYRWWLTAFLALSAIRFLLVSVFKRPEKVRRQFTLKERDVETGLDFFGARYFSNTQGRFVSVDPAGGDPLKPQTFNKYQYAQNNPLCKVDRTGAYEEDVHRDLTTILAYAVGFTWDEAVQIGNENQKVDEDQRDPIQLGEAGCEARRDFHFTTPARRGDLWYTFGVEARGSHPDLRQFRTSTREKAFYSLSTYLHTLQDSYSHAGFGPTFGHMFQGHRPDKTFNDVLKANIMARDTYDALGRALKEFGFSSVNQVSWSKIKRYVDRFNTAKDGKEKKKILDDLRSFIESERLARTINRGFGCIYGEGYHGIRP